MANWNPPQPLWKRNTAGILDFLFAATVFGVPLYKLYATVLIPQPGTYAAENNLKVANLSGWPFWLLVALVIGYFIVLGRTGGTVFQRAFGMKRAEKSSSNQNEILTKESGGEP
jgi:RDD family